MGRALAPTLCLSVSVPEVPPCAPSHVPSAACGEGARSWSPPPLLHPTRPRAASKPCLAAGRVLDRYSPSPSGLLQRGRSLVFVVKRDPPRLRFPCNPNPSPPTRRPASRSAAKSREPRAAAASCGLTPDI